MRSEQWIVVQHWVNSSDTYTGPFLNSRDADAWALDHAKRSGAIGYDIAIIQTEDESLAWPA